ncbi:hypothetical protein DQ04_07561010 [Trypanosoma grayi]|uniref:hypothetical protein n=1 Tax=Trypanosoma grayi TaxID=71804 RepID=UPI0004F423D5|nr:hypothetical protein DQ04_07561010 [Trypanosoma grayi]KEG08270.1 hypothetical protein DQ04_07561010 [Trypanosoma grayi]
MSRRPARPLQLLQSSLGRCLDEGQTRTAPAVAVYKPCGLPYFATSQVAACSSGRHLFAAAAHSVPSVGLSDASDSLLGRMTDLLSPGSGTPRVVVPLMHPALSQYATPSELNAMTAQRKGTALIACAQHDFMFLRNCHRLGLVRCVYRVLCRVPPCVAGRVQRTLREKQAAERTTNSVFKNPYVQQFLQREGNGAEAEAAGITLGGDDALPLCAYPHPLLRGGFYSVKARSLLRHGTVSGYLSSSQLPPPLEALVGQQKRLKALFLSPTVTVKAASSLSALPVVDDNLCDVCRGKGRGDGDTVSHPWMRHECRLRVALDVKAVAARGGTSDEYRHYDMDDDSADASELHQQQEQSVRRLVGKPFKFDFRLITLNSACDLALYEVSTNDASDEEIKAVFAAANLVVLNDYVNDRALADAMLEVTQQLHTVPQLKLSKFPMAVQNLLRQGSPVELVAEPLLTASSSLPVDAAPVAVPAESAALLQNTDEVPQTGLRGHRYRLLLEALTHLKDEKTYLRVAQLVLGSGLECATVHFPDPAQDSNASAVQHLLLCMEKRELTDSYCNSVAERMLFVSRGSTAECSTYSSLLQDDGRLCLPPQRDVAREWSGGHLTLLRLEERSELWCAYCGAAGHTWSSCPEGVPLLPNEEAVTATAVKSSSSSSGSSSDAILTPSNGTRALKGAAEDVLLSTVADVTDALDSAATQRGGSGLIAIPNAAATQAFNPHAWKSNERRPALHQRRLRCAYCSGRHHITQCPKLSSGGDVGVGGVGHEVDAEELRAHASRLFCIKCGKLGHLYSSCPLVPAGLHAATHCPICLLPHRTIRHAPSQCPRRVTPPREYSSAGVPAGVGQSGGCCSRTPFSHRGSASADTCYLCLVLRGCCCCLCVCVC